MERVRSRNSSCRYCECHMEPTCPYKPYCSIHCRELDTDDDQDDPESLRYDDRIAAGFAMLSEEFGTTDADYDLLDEYE